MDLKNIYNNKNIFPAIYRGYVIWNDDTKNQGRIKVFVPGIYDNKYELIPESLPWARPFSPVFGGGSNNPNNEDKHVLNDEVGWCSVPHAGNIKTGSQVFIFFENGNINFPVYFGVAQSGEGWFSEHPNQHCFRSDNIRIRIDENVKDKRSSTKFDSYSLNNSDVSKANLERTCKKNNWEFDKSNGVIKQLETRLDIEIEASKYNAVNLNIHGNVNMHIDGDWFVDHIGDYYEYRKGDKYIKQDGNTYIEERGIKRSILNGPESIEHNGNYTKNQIGDTLITRHGKYHDQIDNNVSHIYGENLKTKIGKTYYEMIGYDKNVNIGNNYNASIVNNGTVTFGGFFDFSIDEYLNFNIKDNINIHSREGNIILKTDGMFELMDGPIVTCDGFKNLGTKGNIQFISTFGNINMQCVKNDSFANFNQRSVVIPWNPEFVLKVKEKYNYDFKISEAMLKGMKLPTNVNSIEDFSLLLNEVEKLKIYDGLPVFIPTKMIVQNPNISIPNNETDLSWIPTFRSEPNDWRSIHSDVMWKLPGKMMGNINIESWSGDINIKTNSSIGCAGNINIEAIENGGTLPGYKIGSISFNNFGKERIYPDPRDLFLDSDFDELENGKCQLFKHGTNFKSGPVLHKSVDSNIKSIFGKTFEFLSTDYNKFYKKNSLDVITFGNSKYASKNDKIKAEKIVNNKPPKLGCSKCITDYLMGIPGIQEIFYKNSNVIDLIGGRHEYGFQRLNPKDIFNPRGVFNINSKNFYKTSIGDGHAINIGFIDKDFSSNSIGGFSLNSNGDFNFSIGKNSFIKINYLRDLALLKNDYIYIETPMDYNSPECLNNFIKKIGDDFKTKGIGYNYVKPGKSILLGEGCGESRTFDAGFRNLEVMPKLSWNYNGFVLFHNKLHGFKNLIKEKNDERSIIDYGFNFEKSKSEIESNKTNDLIVNFYDNEKYEINKNQWIDQTIINGGNSRWFQIKNFDENEHIELSSNLNYHSYVFIDLSENHKKYYKFNNYGFVWWDNLSFKNDLVPYFPDSEFITHSEKYDQMWRNENNLKEGSYEFKEHKSWSKYGNHIKNDDHKDYSPIVGKCNIVYKKAEKKGDQYENKVNSAASLWINKKGGGVLNSNIINRTALPHKNKIQLNSCDDGKNQNIEDIIILNAKNDIIITESKLAGNNNFYDSYISGDINRRTITYEAAVNSHIIELNSNHSALEKIDKSYSNSFRDNNYILQAGNVYKTILKGNQDYCNYVLNPDTQNDCIIHHTEHSNNFEFSQNGFPINKIKVLNGTNTKWDKAGSPNVGVWPDGKKPKDAKFGNNEFIISNGGMGDIDPPTTGNKCGISPLVSSLNNFKISNGINCENISYNGFGVDNGIGIKDGTNETLINNGDILNNGKNIIRINNQGLPGASNVLNSITLNNDNQHENIILSDICKGAPTNQSISLYSSKLIGNFASNEFRVNTPLITEVSKIGNLDIDSYNLNSNIININSKTINQISKELTINSEIITSSSNTLTINSKSFNEISDNFSCISNTILYKGASITILSPAVMVNHLIGIGVFNGHSTGSFIGSAGTSTGSPFGTVPGGVGITVTPPVAHSPQPPASPSSPKSPIYFDPKMNKDNPETQEKNSISLIESFKKIFKSFIKLELSFINIETIKDK